jgi:hypothetical protein
MTMLPGLPRVRRSVYSSAWRSASSIPAWRLALAPASMQARIGHARASIDVSRAPEPGGLTGRDPRRDLNAAENVELSRLYDGGTIGQAARALGPHKLVLARHP